MYKLYANCLPVKGHNRTVIYDLQTRDYNFFPNGFLRKNENVIVPEEMKNFLIKKRYIFNAPKELSQNFPILDLFWDDPSIINNVVINISQHMLKQINNYINLITKLGCSHIFVITESLINIGDLSHILNSVLDSKIESISIIAIYDVSFNEDSILKLLKNNLRIKSIIIYEAPTKIVIKEKNDSYGNAIFIMNKYLKNGFSVRLQNLSLTAELFTESQKHHTYFNRKLYIGSNGEIKNAPECVESFGNIQDIKDAEELKQLIAQPSFQKYWFVHKELCDVCKDCEFRHMCVDNRLPYQRKDESWYHQTECNYNPYICKWQGEEGYQTLAECGVITDERGYSRDNEKIAAINEKLWAD